MVQLVESDIKTREVLDWKGVHVLHFMGSSCSQKLRVFLNLKGIRPAFSLLMSLACLARSRQLDCMCIDWYSMYPRPCSRGRPC